MTEPQHIENTRNERLAYHYHPAEDTGHDLPAVMFCGGFRSDMDGTKALYLEEQCRARGQAYVRFDYSGHGISGGTFEEGTIGQWMNDAHLILAHTVKDNVILVGSSMGGWISLLLGQKCAANIAGIIGIAAAPDFTRDLYDSFNHEQKENLQTDGFVALPNDYSDEPYIFTRALIEDGNDRCLLEQENTYPMPIRLIQGMKDTDVPWQTAFRIKNTIPDGNVEVLLVEQGDHRLSQPDQLELIDQQVKILSGIKNDKP